MDVQAEPLWTRYDGLVCDLDGVVYRGPSAVPGAMETLNALTATGLGVVFATNNASRPPGEVATHLGELGLDAGSWSVATSAEAAAAHLADTLAAGTRVFAVGGPGVPLALAGAGLRPVAVDELADGPVAAIVQGLGIEVTWRELAEIAHLSRDGVPWVATNLDITLPSARGVTPGNGALVALVRTATDAEPHVTGKPGPALYELSRRRLGTRAARTLACGDRLDTDIAGATADGLDSLLVLSGAATLQDLAAAGPGERPTYVARDLTGLLAPGVALRAGEDARVRWGQDGRPELAPDPGPAIAPEVLMAAVVGSAWAARDGGRVLSTEPRVWQELERRLCLTPDATPRRATPLQRAPG